METCPKIFTFMRIYQVFYLSRFGTCRCKPMTTPESPKQCKGLEEILCYKDDQCGMGGYCDTLLTEPGVCRCKPTPTPEPPKHCKELEETICHRDDQQCGVGGYCYRPFLSMFGQCKCKGIIT